MALPFSFVSSGKPTQVLPHMPESKRNFVHDVSTLLLSSYWVSYVLFPQLAQVYRVDSRMVDAEPQRSVELIRRIDSRIPTPLLSQHLQSHPVPPSNPLGRLLLDPSRIGTPPTKSTTSASSAPKSGWAAIASTPKTPSAGSNGASPARLVVALPSGSPRPPQGQASTALAKQNQPAPLSPQEVPSDWEDDA